MKKLLGAFLVLVLMVASLSATVLAGRKSYFPITLIDDEDDRTVIEDFSVTYVEYIEKDKVLRIHYNVEVDSYYSDGLVDLKCYDEAGKHFKSVRFRYNKSSIDVPEKTASIELIGYDSYYGDSYLYKKYVTICNRYGEMKEVTDIQAPRYIHEGWDYPVQLYVFDAGIFKESIEVHPRQVAEYRSKGYYTKEDTYDTVTVYAYENGVFTRSMKIPANKVTAYSLVGWYTMEERGTFVTMYSIDGAGQEKMLLVHPRDIEKYRTVGWYTKEERNEFITIYAFDSAGNEKTMEIHPRDIAKYKGVGWYTEEEKNTYVKVYVYDGEKFGEFKLISPDMVDTYRKKMWFTEEEKNAAVEMYSKDEKGVYNKKIIVPQSLVESYKNVGWEDNVEMRKSSLPVTIVHKNSENSFSAMRIDSFEITSVKKSPVQYMSRVEFTCNYVKVYDRNDDYVALICYDSSGIPIKTVDLNLNSGYVDVPDVTASVEMVAKTPYGYSQSYYYCKYVNVYSMDGRSMGITDLQVPVYNLVGWELPVTVYAYENGQFGRSMEIPRYKIPEYKEAGWFTEEEKNSAITMYAYENGVFTRSVVIPANMYYVYKNAGWHSEDEVINAVTMYTFENGRFTRSIKVLREQVYEYQQVGWYTETEVNNAVTMYAFENGAFTRSMSVPERLVSEYRNVGWYTETEVNNAVTLYAFENGGFGRSIRVPQSLVASYKKVGWYTYSEIQEKQKQQAFNSVVNKYNNYKNTKQYNEMFVLIENELPNYKGTSYESQLYTMRTQAMDLWRKNSGKPVGIVGYKISKSYGNAELKITFRNISYKKVIAYKVKFDCFNVFGEYLVDYVNYYDYDADIPVAGSYWATWDLSYYVASDVYNIKNIRVTEVVFEDGTKWVGN